MAEEKSFSQMVEESAAAGTVSRADVHAFQNSVVALSSISEDDAIHLVTINAGKKQDARLWSRFYNETMTEYLICDQAPIGYVTHENAQWLIGYISTDGLITQRNNIELLISILDKGICVPPALCAFALKQVAHAIETGKGPLRVRSKGHVVKTVSADDVALLKRILLAFGNFGQVAISREEAEVLFDINDMTANSDNIDEWQELFSAAITNLVMASSGYAVPERAQALQEGGHQFVTEHIADGVVTRLSHVLDIYQSPLGVDFQELRNASWIEARENQIVSQHEAAWVAERLARNETLHTNEREIIAFLSTHVPSIHPAFQELMGKIAA